MTTAQNVTGPGPVEKGAHVVDARDITRRYGEGETAVDALRGVSLDVRGRRARRGHGPVGLGQVDADAHPRRARQADRAAPSTIAGEEITTMGDDELTQLRRDAHRLRLPVLQPAADADRGGERRAAALDRRREAGRRRGSTSCSARSGSRDRRDAPARRSSPAASSSASRSRARSSRGRRSCSPTSRPATSTRRRAARSSTLMRDSVDSYGQTIVMVTHDPRAAAIADRVLFLADGLIVARPRPARPRPTSSPSMQRASTA